MGACAQRLGAAGVAVDDVVWDVAGPVELEMAVFGPGIHPDPNKVCLVPWGRDVATPFRGPFVDVDDWVLDDEDADPLSACLGAA